MYRITWSSKRGMFVARTGDRKAVQDFFAGSGTEGWPTSSGFALFQKFSSDSVLFVPSSLN